MKPNDPIKIVLLFIVFLEHRAAAEQNVLMVCLGKDVDLNQGCDWETLRPQSPVLFGQILPLLTSVRSLNGMASLSEIEDGTPEVCCLIWNLQITVERIYQLPSSRQI